MIRVSADTIAALSRGIDELPPPIVRPEDPAVAFSGALTLTAMETLAAVITDGFQWHNAAQTAVKAKLLPAPDGKSGWPFAAPQLLTQACNTLDDILNEVRDAPTLPKTTAQVLDWDLRLATTLRLVSGNALSRRLTELQLPIPWHAPPMEHDDFKPTIMDLGVRAALQTHRAHGEYFGTMLERRRLANEAGLSLDKLCPPGFSVRFTERISVVAYAEGKRFIDQITRPGLTMRGRGPETYRRFLLRDTTELSDLGMAVHWGLSSIRNMTLDSDPEALRA